MTQARGIRFTIMQALLLAAIAGCSQAPTSNTPPELPGPGAAKPTGAAASGAVYEVVRPASELRVLVMKGGLLSRFGHNHVVGGPVIGGTIVVADTLSESSFTLSIDVPALEVDNAEWRNDEGEDFASVPSAEDIANTRQNMLGDKVLDAEQYPTINVESVAIAGQLPEFSVLARVTLKGQTRSVPVPVQLDLRRDQLVARGEFTLTQSDFGIEPFSVLLGAISVQDDVRIRYRIIANPVD